MLQIQTDTIPSTQATKSTEAPMAGAQSSVNNGVNVEALLAAREALTKAPEAGGPNYLSFCRSGRRECRKTTALRRT
jgi:hypothetical protein